MLEDLIHEIYEDKKGLVITPRIMNGLLKAINQKNNEISDADLEKFLNNESTLQFVMGHQPLVSPVTTDVISHIENYLNKELPAYHVLEICRKSNHPGDKNLYSVIAATESGKVSCWTSWNESTQSLNHGHYNLTSLEQAEDVIKEYFHDITDEPEKYGYRRSLVICNSLEIHNAKKAEGDDDTHQDKTQENNIIDFQQHKRRR